MPVDEPTPRADLAPYSPAEMALKVEAGGVGKVRLPASQLLVLGVLAGAFIGLGAALATVAGTNTGLGYGPSRLLIGIAFCLGLILVVVGGAELFTGNCLVVMAWAHGKVSTTGVLRNWGLVYLGNFAGAVATAYGIYLSGVYSLGGKAVGATALGIAGAKVNIAWGEAFLRGAFCNALVCLAVWLTYSARTTSDKILSVLFPVIAFVALGFEHSIANMYFVPAGLFLASDFESAAKAAVVAGDPGRLTWPGFLWHNLLPVTLGNIFGGGVMVAAVYWFVYLRDRRTP